MKLKLKIKTQGREKLQVKAMKAHVEVMRKEREMSQEGQRPPKQHFYEWSCQVKGAPERSLDSASLCSLTLVDTTGIKRRHLESS